MFRRGIIAICMLFAPTFGAAQMLDNGGTTAAANTSAFGQDKPFENATTTFDGVVFNLSRPIADPTEGTLYRMVGTLRNTGKSDVEILFYMPLPTLTDELGNVLSASTRSGINACRYNNQWTTDIRRCDEHPNTETASRLAPGVPIPFSLGFGPGETDYNEELAALSNTTTARIHFVYTIDDFQNMKIAEVVIPGIPLPR